MTVLGLALERPPEAVAQDDDADDATPDAPPPAPTAPSSFD